MIMALSVLRDQESLTFVWLKICGPIVLSIHEGTHKGCPYGEFEDAE